MRDVVAVEKDGGRVFEREETFSLTKRGMNREQCSRDVYPSCTMIPEVLRTFYRAFEFREWKFSASVSQVLLHYIRVFEARLIIEEA